MRKLAPIVLLILLAGCKAAGPPTDRIAQIENWAGKQACVGALSRWSRYYRYNGYDRVLGIFPNFREIRVTFIEAGQDGIPAGVYRHAAEFPTMIDDRRMGVVDGVFDVASNTMRGWQCGCNFPPYDIPHEIDCKAGGSSSPLQKAGATAR